MSNAPIDVEIAPPNKIAISGNSPDPAGHTIGVRGIAKGEFSVGVRGEGDSVGVSGSSTNWHGVEGICHGSANGVYGFSESGTGIAGETKTEYNAGVFGRHNAVGGWGVRGVGDASVGVSGASKQSYGVIGDTGESPPSSPFPWDSRVAGVYGICRGGGAGVFGHSVEGNSPAVLGVGPLAGKFEGQVIAASLNADYIGAFDITWTKRHPNGKTESFPMSDIVRRLEALEKKVGISG